MLFVNQIQLVSKPVSHKLYQIFIGMSNSRLKQTYRSFLNQPIQYREIVYQRKDHQPIIKEEFKEDSRMLRSRVAKPTESGLQRILKNQDKYRKKQDKHSLSSSKSQVRTLLSRLNSNSKINKYSTPHRASRIISQNQQIKLQQQSTELKQPKFIEKKQPSKLQLKEIKLKPFIKQPAATAKHEQTVSEKLQMIDERINMLVSKKLKLVMSQTNKKRDMSASVVKMKEESINEELQFLIREIYSLKNGNQYNQVLLMNKKIQFIQTLMAEQITEGELMKKFYYNLNSNKKGKIGSFNHIKSRMADAFKNLNQFQKQHKSMSTKFDSPKSPTAKPLFEQTTNNQAYKHPQLGDYESYRYKHKNVALNLQPLPRSSYKRQFLYLKSLPDQKIINRDHSPFNPNNKQPVSSIYGQDYKSAKGEVTDYKELDAYHDKFKVLKVSYMPKNRIETVSYDRQSYRLPSQSRGHSQGIGKHSNSLSDNEINFNKHMLRSEANREYIGGVSYQRSKIKHQQLRDFQYKLKNMYKS